MDKTISEAVWEVEFDKEFSHTHGMKLSGGFPLCLDVKRIKNFISQVEAQAHKHCIERVEELKFYQEIAGKGSFYVVDVAELKNKLLKQGNEEK